MEKTPAEDAKLHGSETRKKNGIIGFRVEAVERAEIEAAAESAGLTVGSFCRATMLKKALTKPTKKPSLDRALLSQLLGQLGKVGGNLNQIARRLNEGKGVGSERIIAALDDLWILKDEIMKSIRRLDYDNQGQIQSGSRAAFNVSSETREE